jgi:hypothetical protein
MRRSIYRNVEKIKMVQPLHPCTPSRPGGNGGGERRSQAQLCLFAGVLLTSMP